MAKNAIYYLRKMPHTGSHEDLIEACEALGFSVQRTPSGSLVKDADVLVAKVIGDVLTPEISMIDRLDETMPDVTHEQGEAFDRALSKLENEQIAVHEAGHVVAAHNLMLGVCYARLGDLNETQICREYDVDSLTYAHDDIPKVEKVQQFYAAGAAAEKVVFGKYRPHGSSKDCRDVDMMEVLKIQGCTGNAPDGIDVFDDYIRLVEKELRKEQIEGVANALKEKGFLCRDQINSILETIG